MPGETPLIRHQYYNSSVPFRRWLNLSQYTSYPKAREYYDQFSKSEWNKRFSHRLVDERTGKVLKYHIGTVHKKKSPPRVKVDGRYK